MRICDIERALKETVAVVLAGGRGSRLQNLTDHRAKPAVPFGGGYRIIDFTLSNCVNSGLRRVWVITQYRHHSIQKHLDRAWCTVHSDNGQYVEVSATQKRRGDPPAYRGTADAVFENLAIIRAHDPKFVLVLAGDHVYKMDYASMLRIHLRNNAQVTIGSVKVPLSEANRFGIMTVDGNGEVKAFQEKPALPYVVPVDQDFALASMGIYLFDASLLSEILRGDAINQSSLHDFGSDIIPALLARSRIFACPMTDPVSGKTGYWCDVGTIDAYWRANIEFADANHPIHRNEINWPIWAGPRGPTAAAIALDKQQRRCLVNASVVSLGRTVPGARVKHTILSEQVSVGAGSEIVESVILPDVRVGRNCRIRRAIIDSGCRIPDGTDIGYQRSEDRRRFAVTEQGIALVCPSMLCRHSA